MFTGLIQTTGVISGLEKKGRETRFRISPRKNFTDLAHGESIAVNGVCLTVEDFSSDWFYAYASAQTMSVTNLGMLSHGDHVNLERALSLGDRLGGHLVSGHVDCLARITAVEKAGESTIYTLAFPAEYSRQVVDKGSVTLDGISLTITTCGPGFLKVNIIPATREETIISLWSRDRLVNMETDLIGKYVEKMLYSGSAPDRDSRPASAITSDFLRKHGF
ncbi:riboflavin synthase [Desulfonatronovibrio hydrogenovorans]|uniref:riboflavin synthase n=1 Tax=Desulfonatronovibrio hydrogenovorans TaxID=53245 RepID=UPI00048C226D|nr:riboflavin synthase [Desulfonatronovibrio hydrogenovorans]